MAGTVVKVASYITEQLNAVVSKAWKYFVPYTEKCEETCTFPHMSNTVQTHT